MKNKIFSALLSALIFMGLSSFISSPVPDPETFGKEFIETIKKRSKEAYITKYKINTEDFSWINTQIDSNPYITEETKKSYKEYILTDTSFNTKMYNQLSENYDAIEAWIKKDTIDITQLDYVHTFYDLKYYNNMTFSVLDEGIILLKHKSSYYRIGLNQIAFINNKWTYGERLEITKVDQYLNPVNRNNIMNNYDGLVYDTTAIEPAVDTVDFIEDSYSDEMIIENNQNRYSGLHPKQAKKIEKMQKQIDALYLKMDKEYSKEY